MTSNRIQFRLVAAAAAVAALLTGAADAVAPAGSKAYVVNTEGNSVTVVRLDSFGAGATTTIPVGALPQGAAISPMRDRVYVANSDDNAIAVIDTATDALLDADGTPGADPPIALTGFNPTGLAVSPDGSRVFAACQVPGVCVVEIATRTERKITLPSISGGGPIAVAVVALSDTKIYVLDSQQDVVWPVVLDADFSTTGTHTVGAAIPINSGSGHGPRAAALFTDQATQVRRILVVGAGAPVLIRTSDDTKIPTSWTSLGSQTAVAVGGNRAVVANVYNGSVNGGSVDVYDLSATSTQAVSFRAGGLVNGVTISPDGCLAWASCHQFGGHGTTGGPAGVLVQFDPGNVAAAGTTVAIGAGSDGAGPVIGSFPPSDSPPPGGNATTEACVVPARVQLMLKGAGENYTGGKDSLFLIGAYDDGGGAVDYAKPVTFEAGALSRQVTLVPNASGTGWKFNDDTFSLVLKPDPKGSSHGTFTAKWSKQTLRGVVDPDETLAIHLRADGLADAAGSVTLSNRAYVAGNVRGALVAPVTFLAAANAKPSDVSPDVLAMTVGFRSPGTAPATLGAVRVGAGPVLDIRLAGADFTRSGNEYRYSSKANGTSLSVLLDFAHGTMTLRSKGREIGPLAGPLTDVVFDSGDGRGASTVRVRLGSDGPARTY